MNEKDLKLLQSIEINCRDIIINLIFLVESDNKTRLNPLGKNESHKNSYWAVTRNNAVSMAVLRWCHIFGNRNDPIHWHKISNIEVEQTRNKIFEFCKIDPDTWDAIHKDTIDLRNQFLAHSDIFKITPNAFKYTEILLGSTLVMRKEILSILKKQRNNDFLIIKVSNTELIAQAKNMYYQAIIK